MAYPPTDWLPWTTEEYDVGAPATSLHFERWFRNPVAMAQGVPGAPKVVGRAVDIDAGNLTGSVALVGLDDAAKILLVASSVANSAGATGRINAIIGYQLSADGGSTWGAGVSLAQTSLEIGAFDTISSSGSSIINMTGFNAIRLSGTGTLSGSVIWVEGA